MEDKCFECETTEDLHQHHVVPRSRGGTKTVALCHSCHMKAHGRDGNASNSKKLIIDGLRKKRLAGQIQGNPKYGYVISKCRTELLESREEQNVLGIVDSMTKGGAKLTKIVAYLNENDHNNRSGRKWSYHNLYKILENRRNNGRES